MSFTTATPERPSTSTSTAEDGQFQASLEHQQQQIQQLYQQVRQNITQTAQQAARLAQIANPRVNPVQVMVAVDGAIQQTVESLLQRIDQQSGRVKSGTQIWVDQSQMVNALQRSGGPSSKRNRGRRF